MLLEVGVKNWIRNEAVTNQWDERKPQRKKDMTSNSQCSVRKLALNCYCNGNRNPTHRNFHSNDKSRKSQILLLLLQLPTNYTLLNYTKLYRLYGWRLYDNIIQYSKV